jgi:hypothetical protein
MTPLAPESGKYWTALNAALDVVITRELPLDPTSLASAAATVPAFNGPAFRADLSAYANGVAFSRIWERKLRRDFFARPLASLPGGGGRWVK